MLLVQKRAVESSSTENTDSKTCSDCQSVHEGASMVSESSFQECE